MKYLVTGGGGFLGRYIVEQLQKDQHQIRVFCRGNYPELVELGVELFQGDIRNEKEVTDACEGIDGVFHVAAIPGVWGPWEMYHSINTVGTENILKACKDKGIQKLVYTSSPSVIYDGKEHRNLNENYPYPEEYLCHYPHSKALAEKAVLKANGQGNLATCSLRPHLIWGPRDNHLIPRLIQKALSGRLRIVGEGNNLISMSYVENAARAHLQAMNHLDLNSPVAGQAYFINEIEPVNLWEWINQILVQGSIDPLEKKISEKTASRIGHVLEWIYRIVRIPGEPPMTRFVAAQLAGSHYYDVSKARRDFGYQPEVSFEEAMSRLKPEVEKIVNKLQKD